MAPRNIDLAQHRYVRVNDPQTAVAIGPGHAAVVETSSGQRLGLANGRIVSLDGAVTAPMPRNATIAIGAPLVDSAGNVVADDVVAIEAVGSGPVVKADPMAPILDPRIGEMAKQALKALQQGMSR